MDIATLLGFICAVGVVIFAITFSGAVSVMFDFPSLLIVLCGSAGVVLMRYSLKQFFSALQTGMLAIFYRSENPDDVITQVVALAELARRDGILALENKEIKNKFLKQGIQYVVDGLDPIIIENLLYKEMAQKIERHSQGQQVFKAIGEVGPAMGMIGTLIGLVQMMSNLGDPAALGPGMALALLTTLYGAILAHLIAIPISEKLEFRSKEERTINSIIIDAVLSIQRGHNPRIIRDILRTYLPHSKRSKQEGNVKIINTKK